MDKSILINGFVDMNELKNFQEIGSFLFVYKYRDLDNRVPVILMIEDDQKNVLLEKS